MEDLTTFYVIYLATPIASSTANGRLSLLGDQLFVGFEGDLSKRDYILYEES